MITQARFARGVKFFERDFLNRWDLNGYHNSQGSCFFAGVYSDEDVRFINAHKGFKVVWNPGRKRDVFDNLNDDIVVMIGNGIDADISNYKSKRVNIEIKDFSMFKPVPLGMFVYAYLGKSKYKEMYGYDLVKEVEKKIPYKILQGYLGNEMDFVKREYYDKAFINLKINLTGGLTTATEMALMGRKTISNTKVVFCEPYQDIDDIVNLIMAESLLIGKLPTSKLPEGFFTGKEWLSEKFWS